MVIALRETTGGQFPAHTYLLEGTLLVAYIKVGETTPFYFKSGIKGFDRRGRKFEEVTVAQVAKTTLRSVQGSKGATYQVDDQAGTCTCPGFTYRGACKHVQH
jgi:hypothetical protein